MTYEQAIDSIIEKVDEDNTTNGESLARKFFYDAMVELSERPEWSQDDLRDYFVKLEYEIPIDADSITFIQLNTEISGTNCIDKVIDIINTDDDIAINKYLWDDVKTNSSFEHISFSAKEAGWYRLGNTIYLINPSILSEKTIYLILKLKTRNYISSGADAVPCGPIRTLLDSDDLNALYSDKFIVNAINEAIMFYKKSKEYNR